VDQLWLLRFHRLGGRWYTNDVDHNVARLVVVVVMVVLLLYEGYLGTSSSDGLSLSLSLNLRLVVVVLVAVLVVVLMVVVTIVHLSFLEFELSFHEFEFSILEFVVVNLVMMLLVMVFIMMTMLLVTMLLVTMLLVTVLVVVLVAVLVVVGFMTMMLVVVRGCYNISRTLDGDCRTASSESHRRSTIRDHGYGLSIDSLSDGSNIVFVLVLVCLVDLFRGRSRSYNKSLACEGGLYSASARGQSVGGSTLRSNDGNRGSMHSFGSSRNTMLVVLVVVVLVVMLVMVVFVVVLVMVVMGRSGHGIGVSSKSGGVSFSRESDLWSAIRGNNGHFCTMHLVNMGVKIIFSRRGRSCGRYHCSVHSRNRQVKQKKGKRF